MFSVILKKGDIIIFCGYTSPKYYHSFSILPFHLLFFLSPRVNKTLMQQVFYLSVYTSEFIIGPLFKEFISRLVYSYHKGFFAFAF